MQQHLFLFIVLSSLYMFRATVSPIFRSTLTVYTAFWNDVATVLSAAERWHILDGNVSPVGSRQQIWYKKLYIQSAPEDGRICRTKHGQQA